MASDNQKWCFTWFAQKPKASGAERAALVKNTKWASGDTITVSFLDGDPGVQERVRRVARQWTAPGLANLTLDFRNDNDTDIRISFQYAGSWSVIGTTCRSITDRTQPTMNFGWLTPGSDDDEVHRVVLHELGHALGLIHEHQNPGSVIHWNRQQVIKDLSGPPNKWTLDVIEHNMFEPYEAGETNFTAVDPQSIMMYPIPASWTTDGFSAGLNRDLSPTDRDFIAGQYPGHPQVAAERPAERETGQARHYRLGQTGGMRRQGRLGGSSPGHATAIGAEDSRWQGYLLSPDSSLSSGESTSPRLLHVQTLLSLGEFPVHDIDP